MPDFKLEAVYKGRLNRLDDCEFVPGTSYELEITKIKAINGEVTIWVTNLRPGTLLGYVTRPYNEHDFTKDWFINAEVYFDTFIKPKLSHD